MKPIEGRLPNEASLVSIMKVIGYCVTFPSDLAERERMLKLAYETYNSIFDSKETKENFGVFIGTLIAIFDMLLDDESPDEAQDAKPN